jgi:hypothetical protein
MDHAIGCAAGVSNNTAGLRGCAGSGSFRQITNLQEMWVPSVIYNYIMMNIIARLTFVNSCLPCNSMIIAVVRGR